MYQQPQKNYNFIAFPAILLFWVAIIFVIFSKNPYLFSGTTLRSTISAAKVASLLPIPSPNQQAPVVEIENSIKISSRSPNTAPDNLRWDRKLIRTKMHPLKALYSDKIKGHYIFENQLYTWTNSPAELISQPLIPEAMPPKIDPNTKLTKKETPKPKIINSQWSFRLSDSDGEIVGKPVVSPSLIYFTSTNGTIVALKRKTGRVQWTLKFNSAVTQAPLLLNRKLFIATAPDKANHRLVTFEAYTGNKLPMSWRFDGQINQPLTLTREGKLILVTTNKGELVAINPIEQRPAWTYKGGLPLSSPVMDTLDSIYGNDQNGLAFSLNKSDGSLRWQYQLKGASRSKFVAIPESPFISILTNNGYLHTLHQKSGKGLWRFQTSSTASTQEIMAIRLSNKDIEERELKWRYKGWVLWSPCVNNRLCMFNPEEGNLIGRVSTKGKIASLPIISNSKKKSFYLVMEKMTQEGKKPPFPWALGEFIERSAFLKQQNRLAVALALKKAAKTKSNKEKSETEPPNAAKE